MIKLLIQYPADEGTFFDFDYYLDTHMPMAEKLLKEFGFEGYEVQRCTTTVSGEDPKYLCVTQLRFSSLDDLRLGMAEHGPELGEDFSNYTDIQPVATVTEVLAKEFFGPAE